ncbi:MAG: glycosyltransferase family 4 protein, partial [bacterium]|nr:glycosyltransferase family 4 protein [bacterium]
VSWSMMASQGSIAAARFKKAHPATKLVLTLQEGDEESHLKRYVFGNEFLYRLLIRPWHLLVFKRADVITAISEYLANRARQHSRAPVTVIPNGVDVAKFEARSTKSETNLKFKLGFKETDKIIVTASRLVTKNAVGDIIEALQHLPENLKLLIVGSGSLLENLQLTTYNFQLTGRVLFAGEVTHYELPSYLHISDIFVRPSRSEGMGSAFIEAMAAGLPVIATPVGGIPDFLFDPTCTRSDLVSGKRSDLVQTGLFVRVGDPQNIAEKVQLLLSNDDLRSRITENASKMVREKYDWNGIAKEMGKILETSADVK